MTLSVCMITGEPAARVRAVLEQVRPFADEIVVAADAQVDADTLAGYAALADRLFTLEFRLYERHLAWLHAQCSSDWILRLDGDEVPGAAFVDRLPELLARRDIEQYWVRRAWLHPDRAHVLDALPWSVDFLNRLVRNDATLRFPGTLHMHAAPVYPAAYVEEPVYHLELLLADEDARRAKAIRYEVATPHVVAPGGGRLNEAFYLPELRRSPRLADVPRADREVLAQALEPPAFRRRGDASAIRHVALEESDAHWEGRRLEERAYRASVEVLEHQPSLAPGERRPILVAVTNHGTSRWPGGMEARPLVRLSYRWRAADGSVHVAEGLRSPLPGPVASGERAVVPLDVMAPDERGDFVLEVDVVHEHVRWFRQPVAVPVRVERRSELPPVGPRLRETAHGPAPRWPPRRLRIPRVIHRVWLGDAPMPAEQDAMGRTFRTHQPFWKHRLWRDEHLPALGIGRAERRAARSASELSDLVRYEVLRRFGGVYVDTDVECRRRLTPLLRGVTAFAALEAPGRAGTAVLGAVPGHRVFRRAASEARRTLGTGAHSADSTGPYFLTLLLEQETGVAIFGAHTFYPCSSDEPECAGEEFADAYAVHHWSRSWWQERDRV